MYILDLETVFFFSPSEGQKEKGIGAKYDLLRYHNETEMQKNLGSEGTESNAGLKTKLNAGESSTEARPIQD